jgi:hypothetical protein
MSFLSSISILYIICVLFLIHNTAEVLDNWLNKQFIKNKLEIIFVQRKKIIYALVILLCFILPSFQFQEKFVCLRSSICRNQKRCSFNWEFLQTGVHTNGVVYTQNSRDLRFFKTIGEFVQASVWTNGVQQFGKGMQLQVRVIYILLPPPPPQEKG